jgi:hypothetical protein
MIRFLLTALCIITFACANEKVLMSNVKVITLHKDRMVRARRVGAIPQLKCLGGSCEYSPDVVQCKNQGSDGIDAQWKCTSEMDKSVRFERLEVLCEGYENPDDPYILAGSCGLEYTLKSTKPKNIHNSPPPTPKQQHSHHGDLPRYIHTSSQHSSEADTIANIIIFIIIVVFVLVLLIVCLSTSPINNGSHTTTYSTPRSTHHHHHSNSDSGFTSGLFWGSALSSPSRTTNVFHSSPSKSSSSSSSSTHTSTGFSGTRRR